MTEPEKWRRIFGWRLSERSKPAGPAENRDGTRRGEFSSLFQNLCYVCSSLESRDAAENEAGVEEGMKQRSAGPKRRLTGQGKAERRKRIFGRMREGWGYDEIADEERLTARRVRQIVAEALRRREVGDGSARALPRLPGVRPTLRAAGEAIADGDLRVVAALTKVLDRLEGRLDAGERPPARRAFVAATP